MTPIGRSLTLACSLWLAIPGRVFAHEFWIEPSTFTPSAGQHLAVHLRVGEAFEGRPVPRQAQRIVRFDLLTRTVSPILGREGADPAGIVRFDGSAPGILAFQSRRSLMELAAPRFENYLATDGLERISQERAARGESQLAGREAFVRCAKALLHPEATSPTKDAADRPVGLTLELVAEADPSQLGADARLPMRLYFRGHGVGGVLVRAWRPGSSTAIQARTDRDGRFGLPLDEPGTWLVSAVHMTRADDSDEVDWQSWWASLTFQRGALERTGPGAVEDQG